VVDALAQDVPLPEFSKLAAGDMLFIDSSHVAKTGSDVNFLVFEVLPILQPGVIVHVHDILWPFEYPQEWVVKLRWSWNEAYLLRAFLQFNTAFEIMLFNSYVGERRRSFLEKRMPLALSIGGLVWLAAMKTLARCDGPDNREVAMAGRWIVCTGTDRYATWSPPAGRDGIVPTRSLRPEGRRARSSVRQLQEGQAPRRSPRRWPGLAETGKRTVLAVVGRAAARSPLPGSLPAGRGGERTTDRLRHPPLSPCRSAALHGLAQAARHPRAWLDGFEVMVVDAHSLTNSLTATGCHRGGVVLVLDGERSAVRAVVRLRISPGRNLVGVVLNRYRSRIPRFVERYFTYG
jgi:hypothetical protein